LRPFAPAGDEHGSLYLFGGGLPLITETFLDSVPRNGRATPVKSVSDETIYELSEVFGLLADKSRLKILLTLAREGEKHVTALCELLGNASQPAVSHHLTLLRKSGLVASRRDGKHNYYRLTSSRVRDLLEQFFAD